MCTVAIKLKKIDLAPAWLFLCFDGAKIVIKLFSSTATSVQGFVGYIQFATYVF